MTKRMALTAAAAAVASSFLLAPQAAQASDHRPCVSEHEFNTTNGVLARSRLENRWDVRGDAVKRPQVYAAALLGDEFARIYKACGYDIDEAWVVVFYDRAARTWNGKYRIVTPSATLHGNA